MREISKSTDFSYNGVDKEQQHDHKCFFILQGQKYKNDLLKALYSGVFQNSPTRVHFEKEYTLKKF